MGNYKIGGRVAGWLGGWLAGWLSGKNIVTLRPSFIPLGLDRSFLWAECDKNEEDDKEQDIFLKNAEFWIDMIVDEDMAELLGRTEALRRKI